MQLEAKQATVKRLLSFAECLVCNDADADDDANSDADGDGDDDDGFRFDDDKKRRRQKRWSDVGSGGARVFS